VASPFLQSGAVNRRGPAAKTAPPLHARPRTSVSFSRLRVSPSRAPSRWLQRVVLHSRSYIAGTHRAGAPRSSATFSRLRVSLPPSACFPASYRLSGIRGCIRANPDYVTGRRGRLDLYPWIEHPAFCRCEICPPNRQREANRSGKLLEEVWAAPLRIRLRRDSPFPSNRKLSSAAALNLKAEEEKRLAEAVAKAEAEERARQNAVGFGVVADAYRAHLRKEGKDWKREESRIANIEAFISRERDTAAVDIVWYRRVLDEVELLAPETRRHYASTLLAMLNYARAERVISSHQLEGVRVPQVLREDEPDPWTQHEIGVILGPALDEYEREQAAWNEIVSRDKANRGLRSPSFVPLRGLCLVGYFTLMRPKNNKALTWEELTIDPVSRSGWFKLADHKNKRKGITARGALHPKLLDYLLSIRPANASGLVHPNPATGFAYVDIRKQWDHLIEIASRLLGYRLEGRKADFFNLRHSGASHIAASQRDARHLHAKQDGLTDLGV
jgi:hypothetical protein